METPIYQQQNVDKSRKVVSAPSRETDHRKRIVKAGIGLISIFGTNNDMFYDKLLIGLSGELQKTPI